MGLTCSQWLDARAYIRCDARSKQFRDERPRTVPPVSADVDEKIGWANWYVTGHITARVLLDMHLGEAGSAVGVPIKASNPQEAVVRELAAIDNLCRTMLQKGRDQDVADLIDFLANAAITQRSSDVITMVEHAMEAGRQQGPRR